MQFQRISVADVAANLGQMVIADIRDDNSFAQGHMPEAFHLNNGTLSDFMRQVDPDQPVVVVCYHGVSSQGAAQYLAEQGFATVYSMDGGFTAWANQHPDKIAHGA